MQKKQDSFLSTILDDDDIIECLIAFVQGHPEIYDKRDKGHMNPVLVEESYQAIATSLSRIYSRKILGKDQVIGATVNGKCI